MEVKWLGFAVGLENLRLKGTWFLAKAAERIWWCHLLTGKNLGEADRQALRECP